MVADVGAPADWVKINVRRNVSSCYVNICLPLSSVLLDVFLHV